MKLNISSKLLIILLDAVFSFFLFQIVAGLLAYFYYMPPLNGPSRNYGAFVKTG